jgi:hypothetical protein
MPDQFIVVSGEQLDSLIQKAVISALNGRIPQSVTPPQEQSVVYHSREYVRDLLHTTFPTLRKYTNNGLLQATYFGKRVLYRDDHLQIALPRIRIIKRKQKEKTSGSA